MGAGNNKKIIGRNLLKETKNIRKNAAGSWDDRGIL